MLVPQIKTAVSTCLIFNTISNLTFVAILVNQIGNVRTIGINRPEKRNCLDAETVLALEKAIEDFESDDNSLSGVLYGTGGNFCSGYDLKELAENNDPSSLLKRALVKYTSLLPSLFIYFIQKIYISNAQ